MTNRWNNKSDFAVAMKAAAWETRNILELRGAGAMQTACVKQAAEAMNLIDPQTQYVNVDDSVICSAIYCLSFAAAVNAAFVELEINRAWLEYAGMGTKAQRSFSETDMSVTHPGRGTTVIHRLENRGMFEH